RLRFTGDVHALPEGTVFFADEPILRVTAPLPEAQLVESRLLNLLHFQTLVASKAARAVLAAPGKLLVDFGMRRAHGAEAALLAARHRGRRALPRLRLQAGRVRGAAAAQALRGQGELAGPQAGLAPPRGRRPHARGRARARGRPAGGHAPPRARHAGRAAPRPSPVARRVPRARRRRARAASRAAPPPRARRRLPGDRRPGAPRPGRDAGRAVSFRLTAPGDDWLAAAPRLAPPDHGPVPARVGNVA